MPITPLEAQTTQATLHFANALISGNEKEALEALANGAEPAASYFPGGESALMRAIRQSFLSLTEKLLPLFDLTELTGDGWSPLTAAAEAGNLSALRAIAAVDNPRAIRHQGGVSALMCSAGSGSVDCARFLLPLSDPHARDCYGCGPLEWAAKNRFTLDTLNLFLELGLDPNAPGGYTALMVAAERGNRAAVERLIPLSDLDRLESPSNAHTTPRKAVEMAAENEQWECVDLLAAAGPAGEIALYARQALIAGERLPLCEARLAQEEARLLDGAAGPAVGPARPASKL